MSISISAATASVGYASAAPGAKDPAEREAMRDLTKALRTEDVDAARKAYAAIIRNAAPGTQFPRGSAFADLGRALVGGDMAAAKEAFKSMVRGRMDGGAPSTPLPAPVPPQGVEGASTGLVNLVA